MSKEADLRKAIEACIKNGENRVEFVNRSEGVLAKLHTAVNKVEQDSKLDKESKAQVFEKVVSPEEKEKCIKFMLDCVRNRFHVWNKVATLETILAEAPSWKAAFAEVKKYPPYNSVDLRRPDWTPPAESWFQKPRRPIPFFLECTAFCSIALPIFAYLQGCSCLGRWVRFSIGCSLFLIWPMFECCVRRLRSFLPYLVRGSYGIGIQYCELPCCWAPSRGFQPDIPSMLMQKAHQEITEAVNKAVAKRVPGKGNTSASKKAAEPMLQKLKDAKNMGGGSCASWGYWFREPVLAPEAVIEQGSGFGLDNAESPLSVTCDRWSWITLPANLEQTGHMRGLPADGHFDGDCIYFDVPLKGSDEPSRQVWQKLGCMRLSSIRKTIIMIAMLGATLAFAASFFVPHLCIQLPYTLGRQPLRAVFVIDASFSVSAPDFQLELEATTEIIREFNGVYSGDDEAGLYISLVQFATDAVTEFGLTNNLTYVYDHMTRVVQDPGGTVFERGLQVAQAELDKHILEGFPFDLVVFMTDGVDRSAPPSPYPTLKQNVSILGIYIGESTSAKESFSEFICGNTTGCGNFLGADNFEKLKLSAGQIAQDISGLTIVPDTPTCDFPEESVLSLFALVPLGLWWMYLRFPAWHGSAQEENVDRQEPERLRTAGAGQVWADNGKRTSKNARDIELADKSPPARGKP